MIASISSSRSGVRRRPQVEIGHADQLFDVRPADQRAAHQRDLLVEVRLDREAREQRPQQRFGVDVDARARLVFLRDLVDDGDADDRGDPCDGRDRSSGDATCRAASSAAC